MTSATVGEPMRGISSVLDAHRTTPIFLMSLANARDFSAVIKGNIQDAV